MLCAPITVHCAHFIWPYWYVGFSFMKIPSIVSPCLRILSASAFLFTVAFIVEWNCVLFFSIRSIRVGCAICLGTNGSSKAEVPANISQQIYPSLPAGQYHPISTVYTFSTINFWLAVTSFAWRSSLSADIKIFHESLLSCSPQWFVLSWILYVYRTYCIRASPTEDILAA